MTDRIELTGLWVRGNHGVFEHERREGQRFGIDLRLGFDARPAGASDELADTIDYGAVAELVAEIVEGPACNLIEALAERIAAAVLADDGRIVDCAVTVHKPSAPIQREFEDVAVTVLRSRHD